MWTIGEDIEHMSVIISLSSTGKVNNCKALPIYFANKRHELWDNCYGLVTKAL